METTSSFGEWLRRRRRALDLTRDELALQVGCAAATIKKIEADERRPSKQLAERLAGSLRIPDAERAAFLKAARAELAVDRLTPPPATPLPPLPTHLPQNRPTSSPHLRGYTLHEQLGAGGFGAVYRAEQPGVGREVAVKVILPAYANHPDFIRRFEAEAQVVARLEHPHIVPLYDYWREPSGAYLVMRYLLGGSLQTALRGGPWSLDRGTRLLDQIGAALAFAHRRGVVHRDLKPANVLLDEDGHAYLADFGIAKDLVTPTQADITQPDAVVGSPAYLSPEQITDAPITPQTDIYSLGVLLYEVLTGTLPFAELPPVERLARQLSTPLPPLQAQCPDLPVALDAVIQRATAKTPAARYRDVESMLLDWQQTIGLASTPTRTWSEGATAIQITPATRSGAVLPDAAPALIENSEAVTEVGTVENPYKGLHAFLEADAADFFGRMTLTQQLLEHLAEEDAEARFLAVVGPSGSGKSSVVRAGLLPALRRGGLPGSERWFVVELLPGAHPLEELEAALLRIAVNPPASLLEQLQADERGLARAVKRVLPADGETELVLVIDQFEELFTLTEDEAVRAHFLASLRAAVLDPHSRMRIIVTLRADFYDRPLLYAGFGELIQQRTEVVLPLTPEELEQAIASPAMQVGVIPAPELVAVIVKDVGEQPGTLPLLQYALTELFEHRDGRSLTLPAYRASGGVRGALARRADEIYISLDTNGQEAARQLFLRLITLGEGVEDTRRRVLQAEIASLTTSQRATTDTIIPDHSTSMDAVITRYGRARLLSFDHDPITRGPTVEVAHEALLREWGRLRAWLDVSRADVRMQHVLAAAAAEWSAAEHDPSYLLSGARLAQFEGWAAQTGLALTHNERAFLEASVAERAQHEAAEHARQQRELETARQLAATEQRRADEQGHAAARLRRRALYLASALLLALVAAVAAGIFARTAQANLARSERQRLAAEANLALDRGESGDLPALLAIRSLRIAYSPQADGALLHALARPFTRQRFASTRYIFSVAFSPNGKQFLTGSNDQTARLWDAKTGQQLRVFSIPNDGAQSVAFSPDSKWVLTGNFSGLAQVWNAQTGAQLQEFHGHTNGIAGVAFSPDSKYALTGSADQTVRLWDAQTGQEVRQFKGHTDAVTSVAFAPDGKWVLSGSKDKTARLWDVATGHEVHQFKGHTDAVNGVAFSPDGKYALTGSDDHTVRLWDAQTGQEIRQFKGHGDSVYGVAFSPNGKYALSGSNDETARLWDVATGQQVDVFIGHTDVINSVAFSPDGKQVLTGSNDFTARLWDIRAETEPRTFTGHTSGIDAVSFSPDGRWILSSSDDQTVRLWDFQTGQEVRQFKGHTAPAYSSSFSSDGKQVLTSSYDGTARLWDFQTGQELRQFKCACQYSRVALSPDGKFVLTGSWGDHAAWLWDVATGQQVRQFRGHSDGVTSVAFSPDGKYALTGSFDTTARLWDVATGQEVRQFNGHSGTLFGVAFSPDGKYVLTGSIDKTARLWDVSTGQEVRRFLGHDGGLGGAVTFSPNGKYVLTSSDDHTVRLWDVATGQQLRQFSNDTDNVSGLTFSPDGKYVLTGGWGGILKLWRIDEQEVLRFACATLPRDLTAEERATYSITDTAPTCPKP